MYLNNDIVIVSSGKSCTPVGVSASADYLPFMSALHSLYYYASTALWYAVPTVADPSAHLSFLLFTVLEVRML